MVKHLITWQSGRSPKVVVLFQLQTWWRHQMETFSALLAICAGNSPVTGEFPMQRPVMRSFDVFFDLHLNKRCGIHQWPVNSRHKSQWRGALMFSLICIWINDWVNNCEAGDLRCFHTRYVIVMNFSSNMIGLFQLHDTPLWKSNWNLFST